MKCSICKIEKENSDFYIDRSRKGGIHHRCKDCSRIEYRARRVRNADGYKKKDARYYQNNKEKIKSARREYAKENYHKNLAREKVRRAVYSGKLTRPSNCSECGKDCMPDAHHEDYSKPLEVIWLCRECHMRLHHGK